MTQNKETPPAADGAPVERGVGRPAPERAEDGALLERAAMAAGLRVLSWLQDRYPFVEDDAGKRYGWNPLVFDSDALRLAVDLGLVVDTSRPSAGPPFYSHACAQMDFTDRHAATRRAIVRAAAECCKTPNVGGNRLAPTQEQR